MNPDNRTPIYSSPTPISPQQLQKSPLVPLKLFTLLVVMVYVLAALSAAATVAYLCAITISAQMAEMTIVMLVITLSMIVYANGLRKHHESMYKRLRRSSILLLASFVITVALIPILPGMVRSTLHQSVAWTIGNSLAWLTFFLIGIVWIYGLIVLAKKPVKELFGIWS